MVRGLLCVIFSGRHAYYLTLYVVTLLTSPLQDGEELRLRRPKCRDEVALLDSIIYRTQRRGINKALPEQLSGWVSVL